MWQVVIDNESILIIKNNHLMEICGMRINYGVQVPYLYHVKKFVSNRSTDSRRLCLF